ncbi:MAG: MATE efflux family [Beijerinckiaceae bacterium]|nr:MAG: MATE efflux family [Beijerinckiaceae bacterium]
MNAPARPNPPPAGGTPPRFTQGSTMRHVIEMTVTGAIGLMAIFVVDFLSLFYISRLGNTELTAGVGYAVTVLYLAVSANIGSMIAGIALVSRAIGAGNRALARQRAASAVAFACLFGAAVSILLLALLPFILDKLGASGVPKDVASRFLWITLPANILMSAGMMLSGFLRAVGDPRRAMQVTLFGGIVTAAMDPLLIFGAGLGTDGAAIATVISRVVFTAVGLSSVVRVHKLLQWPRWHDMKQDAKAFFDIAVPAILTNVATPVGGLFFMRILAPFGAEAIAANAILDRLVPLAFGALFALSGAIGPILGQNLGAGLYDRLRQAMRDAFIFGGLYALAAWAILIVLRHQITALFSVGGATAEYVAFFCLVGGMAWVFIGFVLIANAAFNNLGFPLYSTAFNWGRATLGTVPLAWLGASMAGVQGAIVGLIVGSLVFGIAAVWVVFRAIGEVEVRVKLKAAAGQAPA